jgi:hypothetical protein
MDDEPTTRRRMKPFIGRTLDRLPSHSVNAGDEGKRDHAGAQKSFLCAAGEKFAGGVIPPEREMRVNV